MQFVKLKETYHYYQVRKSNANCNPYAFIGNFFELDVNIFSIDIQSFFRFCLF